jgi:translation initiation factor IF-1
MKKNKIREKGQVIEAFPSLLFKVKLDNGKEILAHLGGKLKLYRIKVLPGDKVLVELSPYDENRGRIVYRLK